VQRCMGHPDALLPGAELIVLTPFFAGLMGSWACFYDAERAIQLSGRASSHSECDWSRWRYVIFHVRQNIALVFLPILLLIIVKGLRGILGIDNELTSKVMGIVSMIGFVILF